MKDRKNRLNRLEETKGSEQPNQKATESDTVEDLPTVLMYLPEEVVEKLRQTYRRLNVEYAEETGEDLPKNQVYYPAVIEAGVRAVNVDQLLDR